MHRKSTNTFSYDEVGDEAKAEPARHAKVALLRLGAQTSDLVVRAGKILNEQSTSLGYGLFMRWVADETGLSHSTANRYMRAASYFGDEFVNLKNFTPYALFILGRKKSVPQSARDEAIRRANAGEYISIAVATKIRDAHCPVPSQTVGHNDNAANTRKASRAKARQETSPTTQAPDDGPEDQATAENLDEPPKDLSPGEWQEWVDEHRKYNWVSPAAHASGKSLEGQRFPKDATDGEQCRIVLELFAKSSPGAKRKIWRYIADPVRWRLRWDAPPEKWWTRYSLHIWSPPTDPASIKELQMPAYIPNGSAVRDEELEVNERDAPGSADVGDRTSPDRLQ